ncbi:hypothetical protein BDD14_3693 [Edaphobacter modestus]|uniref:Uncharacterized protein n=1 Tax=Edaphobacter modestus TaxID=388466 RepID=A0A4V6MFV7_9BACT|nr:hypothetical protein BDD14_3693 [Edaphobacter modestus]
MPHGPERRQQTGQLHFITFSCYRRLPFLQNPDSKNTLVQVIEKTRRSHSLTIYAGFSRRNRVSTSRLYLSC